MHLFSTVMHCGASFLDCDALYNNTPRDKSELRCQPGLLGFTSCCRAAVRAQCNGHCTAEKKLVQWCTMQCSAVQCTYSVWNVRCCTYSADTSTCAPVHALHLTGAQVSTPGASGVYMQSYALRLLCNQSAGCAYLRDAHCNAYLNTCILAYCKL